MTEPRNRHEAYATPPPPWNLSHDFWQNAKPFSGSIAAENGEPDTTETLALKPDDCIRKIFEARPELGWLQLIYDDGRVHVYTKVMPKGPPSYGMKTDEGNTAVDLAVRSAVSLAYELGADEDVGPIVVAIVFAVERFAEGNNVDMSEVNTSTVRNLIRMRVRQYLGEADPS